MKRVKVKFLMQTDDGKTELLPPDDLRQFSDAYGI